MPLELTHTYNRFTERFWSKIARTSGCWIWTNSLNGGYGIFTAYVHGIRLRRIKRNKQLLRQAENA